jgi:hypothetical protein
MTLMNYYCSTGVKGKVLTSKSMQIEAVIGNLSQCMSTTRVRYRSIDGTIAASQLGESHSFLTTTPSTRS